MVEIKRGPEIEGVEINRENLLEQIRFSTRNGRGPEAPEALTIDKGITGSDIVGAVKGCVEQGLSVKSGIVLKSLEDTPCTVEQLGDILNACTKGLIKTREKKGDWYDTRLPEMAQYRSLGHKVLDLFDAAVNQRPKYLVD